MKTRHVYLVWGWDGDNEYLAGIYASAAAAKRAYPAPFGEGKGWIREDAGGWMNQRLGLSACWITRERVYGVKP